MEITLKLISGLCWTSVYILLIYNGFKHKSYGMPLLALGLNLAWEAIYSFYKIDPSSIGLQRGINIVWFLFDLIIVYQYFKFGKKHFTKKLSDKLFIPWSIVAFTISFAIQFLFLYEFGGDMGPKYAAFLQNLVMSFLFIGMIIQRSDITGISLSVAVLKWIGTLAPTILFGMENSFILGIGILCAVVDIIYIGLVYHLKGRVRIQAAN